MTQAQHKAVISMTPAVDCSDRSHTRPYQRPTGQEEGNHTKQNKAEKSKPSLKIASKFCRPGYCSCALQSQLSDFQQILTNVGLCSLCYPLHSLYVYDFLTDFVKENPPASFSHHSLETLAHLQICVHLTLAGL